MPEKASGIQPAVSPLPECQRERSMSFMKDFATNSGKDSMRMAHQLAEMSHKERREIYRLRKECQQVFERCKYGKSQKEREMEALETRLKALDEKEWEEKKRGEGRKSLSASEILKVQERLEAEQKQGAQLNGVLSVLELELEREKQRMRLLQRGPQSDKNQNLRRHNAMGEHDREVVEAHADTACLLSSRSAAASEQASPTSEQPAVAKEKSKLSSPGNGGAKWTHALLPEEEQYLIAIFRDRVKMRKKPKSSPERSKAKQEAGLSTEEMRFFFLASSLMTSSLSRTN